MYGKGQNGNDSVPELDSFAPLNIEECTPWAELERAFSELIIRIKRSWGSQQEVQFPK